LSVQLRSDPPTAIRALMVVVDSLDEYLELLAPGGGVAQGSCALAPGVETRAGRTQLRAHPGDRVCRGLSFSEALVRRRRWCRPRGLDHDRSVRILLVARLRSRSAGAHGCTRSPRRPRLLQLGAKRSTCGVRCR